MSKTQIEMQQRLIDRMTQCHPGHRRRVQRAAEKELHTWFKRQGTDAGTRQACVRDAVDMAYLEMNAD